MSPRVLSLVTNERTDLGAPWPIRGLGSVMQPLMELTSKAGPRTKFITNYLWRQSETLSGWKDLSVDMRHKANIPTVINNVTSAVIETLWGVHLINSIL